MIWFLDFRTGNMKKNHIKLKYFGKRDAKLDYKLYNNEYFDFKTNVDKTAMSRKGNQNGKQNLPSSKGDRLHRRLSIQPLLKKKNILKQTHF